MRENRYRYMTNRAELLASCTRGSKYLALRIYNPLLSYITQQEGNILMKKKNFAHRIFFILNTAKLQSFFHIF